MPSRLLQGIAQGTWPGQISQGNEAQALRDRQVFADVQTWQVVAVDAAVAGAAVLVSNDAEVLGCHRVLDTSAMPVVPGCGHLQPRRSSS